MMTKEELADIETRIADAHCMSMYHHDTAGLVAEVRRLQDELRAWKDADQVHLGASVSWHKAWAEACDERDSARKAARAWKTAARRGRVLMRSCKNLTTELLGKNEEILRLATRAHELRKQCRAWKAKAMEYRDAGAPEMHTLSDRPSPYIPSSRKEEQETRALRFDRLLRTLDALDAQENECVALRKRVDELQAGITRYATAAEAPCTKTTVREADEAYTALLRLVGFRPRVRAKSEVVK
jgi:hypothetical protein